MAGQTADLIGRKRTIQLGCLISLVGCAIQTAAINAAMLIVGRLIAGWAVGVLSMIVPVYQAEISVSKVDRADHLPIDSVLTMRSRPMRVVSCRAGRR